MELIQKSRLIVPVASPQGFISDRGLFVLDHVVRANLSPLHGVKAIKFQMNTRRSRAIYCIVV